MRYSEILGIAVLVLHCSQVADSPTHRESPSPRGIQRVSVPDATGRATRLYRGSHALVVGVSRYYVGWPSLDSVPDEISQVREVLEEHGFEVTEVMDPNARELKDAFEQFVDRYGYLEDYRLLFYFAGHGFTRKNGEKGYLVPADAADPYVDETRFLRQALPMSQIMAWARRLEAKHALFLFDSCFSGTIFRTRSLVGVPPHITLAVDRTVRQFITAGEAGQPVPARSIFTPILVSALRGAGDINRDGYVTGTELGLYLHEEVLRYDTGQSPQFGKLGLDRGDFVFQLSEPLEPPAGTGVMIGGGAPPMPQPDCEPLVGSATFKARDAAEARNLAMLFFLTRWRGELDDPRSVVFKRVQDHAQAVEEIRVLHNPGPPRLELEVGDPDSERRFRVAARYYPCRGWPADPGGGESAAAPG